MRAVHFRDNAQAIAGDQGRRSMSEISVTTVSGRADLREFIMLPFRLYEGVDQWVPPLISERRRHLDRKQTRTSSTPRPSTSWPPRRRVVGRITAQVDERFNEFQDNDWGQFGFFESEDDPASRHGAARRRLRLAAGTRPRPRDRPDGLHHQPRVRAAGRGLRAAGRRSSRTGTTPTTPTCSRATG